MISVIIVEDDSEIRDSLKLLIDDTEGFEVIQTFGDAETALNWLDDEIPDVVLMDIGLPGMSGIDATKQIKKKYPNLDVLVLSIHENDEYVFNALCSGATGYLTKDTSPTKIIDSIKETYNGGAPMSTQIARMVVGSFKIEPSPDLTKRESEVLTELCNGSSYKMIADKLFISEETVRKHLKNIYRKLEVHSKSEAVAKAIRDRLV
ncbi:MAG: response regulator transcription factor [Melioribacteraceae bacterium]|nr:response regulator transcription factor [Melioribacteraceae bacterium]